MLVMFVVVQAQQYVQLVEPLLWDTSIEGTQTLVPEPHPITFVSITSFEGTPLFRRRGSLSGYQNLGLTSIQETA